MSPLQRFGAYAQFEKTFKDDDWSRLGQYFTADAAYDVAVSRSPARFAAPRRSSRA